ncbi:hypothetical protein [Bradyrhizobium sp. HKCCYLRH3061]|uniref:hypothetical protein n=1 Tax=Bradyrhizobium sp. HKCCYLRH3061 TaxID=3420734 RepID=UPI003EC0BCF5
MGQESEFVAIALAAAERILSSPLVVKRGQPLLYEVLVDNNLKLTVDPTHPIRGESAFQTDLCILEKKQEIEVPRVVLEFKTRITTHDVLTYSAKARKHKQVYPYLRYGIVASEELQVPRRFFIHNDALDFFAALKNIRGSNDLDRFFTDFLKAEVETSRRMEKITFGGGRSNVFRSEIFVDQFVKKA